MEILGVDPQHPPIVFLHFGLPTEDKEVEQGTDDGVEEAKDHGQGS